MSLKFALDQSNLHLYLVLLTTDFSTVKLLIIYASHPRGWKKKYVVICQII